MLLFQNDVARNVQLLKELNAATADSDTDRLEMAIQKVWSAGVDDNVKVTSESFSRLLEVHREGK